MKKGRLLVVFSLLIVASMLAAIGTGAIDVFEAQRTSAMVIASDAEGFIGISSDSPYADVATSGNAKGTISFDFKTATAKGFNAQSKTEINNVFTVTNQSAETVYAWLEAEGWSSQHNAGLVYRIQESTGEVERVNEWYWRNPQGLNLLDSTGMNFTDGVGKNAYVKLEPGENFTVQMFVNSNLANGYGAEGKDWGHKIIVKANKTEPTQNGQYH